MIRETQRLYDAIDALCSKRKAKVLKKLVRKAIEAERRAMCHGTIGLTDGTGDVSTHIYAGDPPGTVGIGSYTAQGPDVQAIDPHYTGTTTA